MAFNKVMFSSTHDNWSTPEDVYKELNEEFHFNDDPCPLKSFGYGLDGLARLWGTRAFVNPPFSNIKYWCKKAYAEYLNGKLVVMLIPSRTDTKYWHDYIMKATEIRFIKGRLKFGGSHNSAPFPSAIIVFKPTAFKLEG